MAFVEESDIGTYGLRVFNQFGEAYCEAALVYDGLEVRPGQSLGDCYQGKFVLSVRIEHECARTFLIKKSLGFALVSRENCVCILRLKKKEKQF